VVVGDRIDPAEKRATPIEHWSPRTIANVRAK
jgi:hypothetical protein